MTSIHLCVCVHVPSFFHTPTNIWIHSSVFPQFARGKIARNGQQINENAAAKVKQKIYLQRWLPEESRGIIPVLRFGL